MKNHAPPFEMIESCDSVCESSDPNCSVILCDAHRGQYQLCMPESGKDVMFCLWAHHQEIDSPLTMLYCDNYPIMQISGAIITLKHVYFLHYE